MRATKLRTVRVVPTKSLADACGTIQAKRPAGVGVDLDHGDVLRALSRVRRPGVCSADTALPHLEKLGKEGGQPVNEEHVPAGGGRALVAIPSGRARNMAAIHSTDTKPEIAIRSSLHAAGYRFRRDFRVEADG